MDIQTKTNIAATYRTIKEIADATSYDLTVRQLLLLLDVGRSGEVAQQALADRHDMLKATVSKIVGALSGGKGHVKHTGIGLLAVDLDPSDMRSRLVRLSPDGEKLLTRATREGARR